MNDSNAATLLGAVGHPGDVGLSSADAILRAESAGPNEIRRAERPPAWSILLAQLASPLVWLLLAAATLSALLGELIDTIAIVTIVTANSTVGFVQEFRAERAMESLRSMTSPRARVVRDGRLTTVAAVDVVPGDLIVVEAGDVVPADARIVEAHALATNEAALTGESTPVSKFATAARGTDPLAEQHDRLFMGTSVATGTAKAVITATGMSTELGRIADLLAQTRGEATPLQRQLDRVGRKLAVLCIGTVAVIASIGLLRGSGWLDVALFSASLAVAAVPEGITAITTLALALGVQRLATRNVLVRKMPAVETLGCTTVICTDKTGTLTTGTMTVREIWRADPRRMLDAAAACSTAELDEDERWGTGDPTELALLVAAAERGIRREEIERERPTIELHPFETSRRRMSVLRGDGRLYVKGAVDSLLPLCSADPDPALRMNEDMASRGMRVLCIAVGEGSAEADLELLGLVGLADPPRTEAIDAVAAARAAGIRVIMITGDHPLTARAIAKELRILQPGDHPEAVVHARATPEDKLRIVKALKTDGEIVTMTGDGVNDAPALREAHIGIAMGKDGTDVAREAAAMVLTDDNFASIVAAVREGRGIFDNIRKTIAYLLAGNAAELALVFAASVAGLPLPLTALQILWINLVTETMPGLALVTDPPEGDVLARPPRTPGEALLGKRQWSTVLATAALQGGVALGVFVWALQARDLVTARNLAFSALVFGDVLRSFAARSPTRVFWEVGALTNVRLLGVVALVVMLQLGIHHIPIAQAIFDIGPLSLADCALSLVLGAIPVTVLELRKLVRRQFRRATRSSGAATRASTRSPGSHHA